ncbi:protein Shroom3 isoform X2 [Salarias fasciatus]|uniref:Protein Shroom3-like n=1 Tax=Salarias fasciatus TaxID=181472 RepID=A0A672GBE4_SALFA|nr:protein Shroom3-like isoform X2 [Salarias fasciatus]
MQSGGRPGGGGGPGGGWVLLEARLQGGAPWGFTLQGGLEHGQPLIISKIEEGGKAECLEQPLLVGDEIIIINEVELTGYRQEAIALVKGSHKTLQLTVRRELDAGYIEEFASSPPSFASLLPPPSSPRRTPPSPPRSGPCSGVQLRIRTRRSEPVSRPHSWHSAKLGDARQELDRAAMDTMSSSWHHNYHTSASTMDLSGGFDSGVSYLRKSPDQYSSRGSMESLDPPLSSQLPSGAQHHHHHHHHHPLGHHGHSGSHPTYSSCHQLSSARSSNSIDHLHSKRDSAYSSFSTSSSIPEYLASTPSFSPERSYSLETVPQRGGGGADMQQADLRYVRTVYDNQQGLAQEQELSSSSELRGGGGAARPAARDRQGSVGGVCYHGGSSSGSSSGSSNGGAPASNRHSVGSIWGPAASRSSYESLKGVPAPPRRSDSYAAIRNHERPNSWSSLDHARPLRSLQKGSWHHSSGSVASAKGSYGAEGQLHTVIEKSPESSPTTKPRQGGFPQPPSPTGPPSGPAGPAPALPSSWLILPTSVYPVLRPEPHYAQTPSSNPGSSPGPGPLKVFPAPAKEGGRQQQPPGLTGREDGAAEGGRTTTENGYSHRSYPTTASSQLRTPAYGTESYHQSDSDSRPYSQHRKTPEGELEVRTRLQRPPNEQGSYSQSTQEPSVLMSQAYPDPDQDLDQSFHIQQIHTAPDLRPQTSQDVPVQPRRDRSRSLDQTSSHSSDPVTYPRPAQDQTPHSHAPPHPQPRPVPAYQPSSRHFSESAAMHYQHLDPREQDGDREHPLTRLENALAEVQQCPPPNAVDSAGGHDSSSFSDGPRGPVRSLSVLEKVSRIERRQAGKTRSHSTSTSHNHLRVTEKGRSSPCGAEDLRHMLERSTKAQRTMSYRGGSSEQMKHRSSADPSLALQRSRSTLQVDASSYGDGGKDFPWRQEIQELLGPIQDIHANRSYRDRLKDAQSSVLRSTSFRRRDLSSSVSSPPPAAAPPLPSSGGQQPPPAPAKFPSLEKKGPKTMPKPQGVIITPHFASPVTSPHTPKERHVVSPEVRGPSPPALPVIPPVGAPATFRICGRKRLTADQKKRSYSEPENMNEVGVSDAETAALFRRGGETSVADRRRVFELAASGIGSATSRPDLRQVQQDALAEYVERKRAGRRDEGGHRGGWRPRSAYLGPESSSHTDTLSLSSTSSLLSLQDTALDRSFCSPDRQMLQSNLFYPGRVTTPRPPAQPLPGSPAGSSLELQDLLPAARFGRQAESPSRRLAEPLAEPGPSRQPNGALQRTGSVSAENLLERSDEKPISPQHHRSRSSPSAERMNQDLAPGDVRMFGVFVSEPGRCALAADRPSDVGPSPPPPHVGVEAFRPAGPSPDPGSAHTPAPRRERQRTSERQRALSTSTLAASVGLPCPFSPPGAAEWQASERLSQANLDNITFPQTGGGDGGDGGGGDAVEATDRPSRHSLSDASILEEPAEPFRGRAFSLDTRRDRTRPAPPAGPPPPHGQPAGAPPSPPPPPHPPAQRLSSLRISESGFFDCVDQPPPPPELSVTPQDDLDEVFLQSPARPPPSLPATDTVPTEDFPPPPPPVLFEQAADSCGPEFWDDSRNPPLQSSPSVPPPAVSAPPPVSAVNTSRAEEEPEGLQYLPLPPREKTPEELRVEELSRKLVSLDPSLAPLLDASRGKSTVDMMNEIFPNCRPSLRGQQQQGGGGPAFGRVGEVFSDPAEGEDADGGGPAALEEDEKDLNARKVELVAALRSSMAALQREKEALSEEQRRHRALGASLESLVQERLKPNERDKFSMFIGDLDRIVNLLLSLCGRLSRIDRALLGLQSAELPAEDAADERESLLHKRSLLLRQTEDARELKENLDRRQRAVHAILSGYLSEARLRDYRRFVSAGPSLLMGRRRLDDLLRQEDERLAQLLEALPPELADAHRRPGRPPGPELAVRPTAVTSL